MATKKAHSKINNDALHKEHDHTTIPPATPNGSSPQPDLNARELFINRELSLLAFQRRVLEEAEDPANPLLERVKFLAIVGSNIDEFFMVRVSGLLEQMDAGILDAGPDGISPGAQLVTIRREVKKLSSDAQRCLTDQLLPELREAGIQILEYSDLRPEQRAFADGYFTEV